MSQSEGWDLGVQGLCVLGHSSSRADPWPGLLGTKFKVQCFGVSGCRKQGFRDCKCSGFAWSLALGSGLKE